MEEVQEAAEAGGAARKRKRVGAEDSAELEAADDDAEGAEGEGGVYGKVLLGEDDGEGGIAEEAVAEVMRWLEAEITDDNIVVTAAPAAAAEEDAGFVTINGYEESCGPSFSAAASTVMASVDTRAGAPPPPAVPWPWPEPEPHPETETGLPAATAVDVDVVEMETEEPADEEWLVRLLTCGALLEGVL